MLICKFIWNILYIRSQGFDKTIFAWFKYHYTLPISEVIFPWNTREHYFFFYSINQKPNRGCQWQWASRALTTMVEI